jgi:hypothetical protein
MCLAANIESLTSKALRKSAPSRYLEKNYGIRPSGLGQNLGVVDKQPNLFYQKGGAGYAGDQQYFDTGGPSGGDRFKARGIADRAGGN